MYRFKKEHRDAVIRISHFKEPITADNLTEEKAQVIVKKYPHLAHNIENVSQETIEKDLKAAEEAAEKRKAEQEAKAQEQKKAAQKLQEEKEAKAAEEAAEKEKQEAEAESKQAGSQEGNSEEPKKPSAEERVKAVEAAKTSEELEALAKGETAKMVKQAIAKRAEELENS